MKWNYRVQKVYGSKCSSHQWIDAAAIQVDHSLSSNMWEHVTEAKFNQCKFTVVGVSTPVLFLMLEIAVQMLPPSQRSNDLPQDSEDFDPNI